MRALRYNVSTLCDHCNARWPATSLSVDWNYAVYWRRHTFQPSCVQFFSCRFTFLFLSSPLRRLWIPGRHAGIVCGDSSR